MLNVFLFTIMKSDCLTVFTINDKIIIMICICMEGV